MYRSEAELATESEDRRESFRKELIRFPWFLDEKVVLTKIETILDSEKTPVNTQKLIYLTKLRIALLEATKRASPDSLSDTDVYRVIENTRRFATRHELEHDIYDLSSADILMMRPLLVEIQQESNPRDLRSRLPRQPRLIRRVGYPAQNAHLLLRPEQRTLAQWITYPKIVA